MMQDQSSKQHSIATEVQQAQDQASQIAPISARMADFDIDTAYAVADIIHQRRLAQGDIAAGRKIGFTNPAMWTRFGVQEPVWGHMYTRTVMYLSDAPARYSLQGFAEPKIEPEIALHFHCAPPEDADVTVLLDCIDWMAASFEVVQSHYPNWQFKAADTIADGGLHGMLALGQPTPLAALGEDLIAQLTACTVTLACDGVVCETGAGKNALGNPLAATAHLLAVLAKQAIRRPIRAGEIITTGTLTTPMPIFAGQCWRMELQGIALSDIEITFT